jgi:RNA polymerase sigma factor (sigma-70 family)
MNLSAVEATPEADGGFVAFFNAHYGDVAKALFLLTRNAGEAEELTQEAMTRVYERWSRVRTMDAPAGYLYRTALNLQRKRARRSAIAAAMHVPGGREGVDPARVVEDRSEVLRLLATLSVHQRQAVVLVEWLGLDSTEAAAVLGIKPVSVRTRLHRAKEALQAASRGEIHE